MEKNRAEQTCTALDLATVIDRLKSNDGSIDHDKLERLIKQLSKFGPYYKDVLETIVVNLK